MVKEKESQEKSLRTHMVKLIKLTRNLNHLLNKLLDYEVLDLVEVQQINHCSDDETSCHFLYEVILTKLPDSFDLLLFALRDTDNDRLAQLIEDSSKFGDESVRRLRRQSSTERYSKPETRALHIDGSEMGIAEILEDYPEYWTTSIRTNSNSPNFTNLANTLKLQDFDVSKIQNYQNLRNNFVFGATLVLQEWTNAMKSKANVVMLCRLLENDGQADPECAERVRRMFDNYVDSGFAFDFPGNFTISVSGKEPKIAEVLNDNPSFCLNPERLYLLLKLPEKNITNFIKEANFVKNAIKMLNEWTSCNPKGSSIDHLACVLAFNGHFCSAEKVSHL